MSRKSRQRQKPELGPNRPAAELPDGSQATVYRLTGKMHDMLEAIVSGCAILAQTPEPDDALWRDDLPDQQFDDEVDDEELDEDLWADGPTDTDLVADISETLEAYSGLTLMPRVLARELLAQALDRRPAQSVASHFSIESGADEPNEAAVVDNLVEALLPANLPEPMRPSRQARRDAFGEAAWLIREVGLEEFDVSCDLDTAADGTPEMFTSSVPPESAHVALLEYVFNRAEGVVANLDPLLAIERDASFWEFSQWNVSPPPGPMATEMAAFTGSVREQEYSLAGRRTLTLGRSVVSELAKDEGFAEVFPRQYRMAVALTASFVDVFQCVGLEEARARFRSMRDGRTFEVHEHMNPPKYAPGWLAMGRLLPFDGELHLRSPGMLFVDPIDPTHFKAAVEAFADAAAAEPPALALEVFISADVFGIPVPRSVKPARSKADARAMLELIEEILDDVEAERAGSDDVTGVPAETYYTPGVHTDSDSPGAGGIELDATLELFMEALAEQAAGGGRERQQPARTKKKKGKRRR